MNYDALTPLMPPIIIFVTLMIILLIVRAMWPSSVPEDWMDESENEYLKYEAVPSPKYVPEVPVCINCGLSVLPDDIFCMNCGGKL